MSRKPKLMEMKKIIFALAILTFVLLSVNKIYAQENCKYTVDKKDPFTEKPIHAIRTPIKVSIFPNFNWQLFLYKIGDDYHIETSLAFSGALNDFLEKGDSIMFKLSDGKIISCYARERITPRPIGTPSDPFTAYQNIFYPITKEDFILFTTSLVTFAQMNIGTRAIQDKVNDKNAKKILEGALCVMK
jgi:hypothetical protein